MQKYFNRWSSKEDVARDFGIDVKELKSVEILYADYSYEDYSGSAFVLFRKGKKYYEVHGSHCSCYGLEEQWSPEETDIKALKHRVENGYGHYIPQLEKLLANKKSL